MQRVITGTGLALVIAVSITWNAYSFIFLLCTIDVLALLEFYRLFHATGLSPSKQGGVLLSGVLIITFALVIGKIVGPNILLVNIFIACGIFIVELFRRKPAPFHNLAFTFLGILCITIPLCFFFAIAWFPLHAGIYHPQIPLGYFLILWASDSGAYFIGKAWGAHPLFKRVSPHKTWEGSMGGASCALLAAYFISRYFPAQDAIGWIGMAVIIIVMGTFGDLIKSLMKRSLDVKDSGTILPGHGGMLDRFDSLLGSAPVVFSYLILLPSGG